VNKPFVAIVDDDNALCFSLTDLMRAAGYRADAFASTDMLLTAPDLVDFDCIIADVQMPGTGGFTLVQELRERGVTTPVILITAVPDKRLNEQAALVGAECLLRKPFQTDCLLGRIERSLSHLQLHSYGRPAARRFYKAPETDPMVER
jgi:FixJ family two-component response regulator